MSLPFTSSEIAFLKRHGLTSNDVHDGRRQSKAEWQRQAKESGKVLVLASPCRNGGHRLKTRSGGHCVECDPKKMSYQNRHSSPGHVYVAGSRLGGVVKIGTAIDIAQRERNLRNQKYGGLSDWRIVFHMKVREGGRIERDAISRLQNHRVTCVYEKDGSAQEAGEILRCPFRVALKALADAVGDNERTEIWRSESYRDYEFDR